MPPTQKILPTVDGHSQFIQDPETSAAAGLNFAPREDYDFSDIIVPRFGLEYRLLKQTLAIRAGFEYRPAVAAIPSQRSNLLDGATSALSLGAGYDWGDLFEDDGENTRGTIDLVGRYMSMRGGDVTKDQVYELNDSSYALNVFEVGATVTLGWE